MILLLFELYDFINIKNYTLLSCISKLAYLKAYPFNIL